MDTRPRIVVAYHGIFQDLTDPSWTAWFQAFLLGAATPPRPLYDSDHYWAGPIGVVNWFRNRRHGKALARRLATIREGVGADLRIDMVGHSNGTNILVEAAKELRREYGIRTERMVLVGSAVRGDIGRNGLAELVDGGFLGRATCYISDKDGVIGTPGWLRWPYGDLGVTGWLVDGEPLPRTSPWARFFWTRIFGGFRHNDYFEAPYRQRVFRAICEDLEIPLAAAEKPASSHNARSLPPALHAFACQRRRLGDKGTIPADASVGAVATAAEAHLRMALGLENAAGYWPWDPSRFDAMAETSDHLAIAGGLVADAYDRQRLVEIRQPGEWSDEEQTP